METDYKGQALEELKKALKTWLDVADRDGNDPRVDESAVLYNLLTESLENKCRRQQKERDYYLDDEKYLLVHIDGRTFSKLVKNHFKKPFDEKFVKIMDETAEYLCKNIPGVRFAYVQSDEISLVLKKKTAVSELFFGGRLCKIQSIIAAMATAKFNHLMFNYEVKTHGYDYTLEDGEDTIYRVSDCVKLMDNMPCYQFDCKAWDVKEKNDAVAWFLFRNIDCVRNSKLQFAQSLASHKELVGKDCDEVLEYVKDKGDWNALRDGLKYGRLVTRKEVDRGDGVMRMRWVAEEGTDLTVEENRETLVNIFSEDEKE